MAIIRVRENYPTIQEAIDAAQSGDIILVENGVYNEELVITKDNLKIIGETRTVLDGEFALSTGILFENVTDAVVKSLKARNYNSYGIYVSNGASVSIVECAASDCGGTGICGFRPADIHIYGSSVSGNADYGICLYSPTRGIVEHSDVASNFSYGIFLNLGGSETVEFISNTVRKNLGCGICAYQSTVNIIENEIRENLGCGICVNDCANSVVSGNTVRENLLTGIYQLGGSVTVKRNCAAENKTDGISINGNGCAVVGNRVCANGQNGIAILSAENIVQNNNSLDNALFDILRGEPNNCFSNNAYKTASPCPLTSFCPDTGEDAENPPGAPKGM